MASSPKRWYGKWDRGDNFPVEKSNKYYFSHVIKVGINKNPLILCTLYTLQAWGSTSEVLHPKTHDPSPILTNTLDKVL